jgi:hypothetical protein
MLDRSRLMPAPWSELAKEKAEKNQEKDRSS